MPASRQRGLMNEDVGTGFDRDNESKTPVDVVKLDNSFSHFQSNQAASLTPPLARALAGNPAFSAASSMTESQPSFTSSRIAADSDNASCFAYSRQRQSVTGSKEVQTLILGMMCVPKNRKDAAAGRHDGK
jgi:hypothetical protein